MDTMDSPSELTLLPFAGGWHIVEAGKPIFWFPHKDQAVETAVLIADSRTRYFDRTTVVIVPD